MSSRRFAALLYYERIALREEEYLTNKFGGAFLDWAARTPAIVPAFHRYGRPATPFNWRKAARGEYDGVFKVTTLFFALEVLQDRAITGRLTLDPLWTGLLVIGSVLFVVLRTLKKRGLLADCAITAIRRTDATA